ncbi:linear amide C-N hydrolase [Serratia bockelmannii]|uniref:linear amide C-N hydrolase n=1 Tax=Serratia bockelmannii TaxID=2703793 RepID=UPI003FA70CB2
MKKRQWQRAKMAGVTALLGSFLALHVAPVAQACTRILWNADPEGKVGVLVGRSMDWPTQTQPVLTLFPAGTAHNGGRLGNKIAVAENPAIWTSKYASLVTTIYGIGAADGVNEKGLAAHLLYLTETQMPEREPSKPGLHVGLWAQYVLDNAATVKEALAMLDNVQLVMAVIDMPGRQVRGTVHLMMEDASGDSALIEYVDGKTVVHHGRDVRVVTNDPPYDQQMAQVKKLIAGLKAQGDDPAHPDSALPLPGNVSPLDRLVRASYFLHLMPAPQTERSGVADMLAIARNVSVPFGTPYKPKDGMAIYNTEYRTAISLKSRRYFFELTTSPGVVWAELANVASPPLGQVMRFDPYAVENVNVTGDISGRFRPGNVPY